ncbi:MAG: prepilin peptidase [Thermoguttaceae bacterium]
MIAPLAILPMSGRLAALFLVGACAGSLANWAIYRLAWRRRAIGPWSPPSAEAPPRRPWDRLPILGWLGLRREAALHGRGFWLRPMLIELATGGLFAGLYWWEVGQLGLLPPELRRIPIAWLATICHCPLPTLLDGQYMAHVILLTLMLAATWIDLDEQTIPDAVIVPGTLLGLALAAAWPYTLLPDVVPPPVAGPWALPKIGLVWLSSPGECQPWANPAWTGPAALGLGVACLLGWCTALLPRTWYARHGVARAWQLLLARMVRERATWAILAMGTLGSAATCAVWRLGGLRWAALLSALAGLAAGGGMVWMVRVLGRAVLRREAMGLGDVTLMAMIGAFLGWQAAVVVFFLAPLAGLVLGLVRWLGHGESEIPYGPFLCLAALTTTVAWAAVWEQVQDVFALGWRLPLVLVFSLAMIVVLLPLVRWAMSLVR